MTILTHLHPLPELCLNLGEVQQYYFFPLSETDLNFGLELSQFIHTPLVLKALCPQGHAYEYTYTNAFV